MHTFHKALQKGEDANKILLGAKRQPGQLLSNGLALMQQFADSSSHALEGGRRAVLPPTAVQYLKSILVQLCGQEVEPEPRVSE